MLVPKRLGWHVRTSQAQIHLLSLSEEECGWGLVEGSLLWRHVYWVSHLTAKLVSLQRVIEAIHNFSRECFVLAGPCS